MIVVAIIGILASIAIPAYQDYTQRAQIREAFVFADALTTAIAELAQSNSAYPTATEILSRGLNANGTYSSAVVTPNTGVIIITMGNVGSVGADIATKTITFTPPALAGITGSFTWICTSTAQQKFLPKYCTGV